MISRNTNLNSQELMLKSFFASRQSQMWTALPGIIRSFDANAITCEVQPAIQGKRTKEDGTVEVINLPVLLDCPVVFPHAGGCSMTFPIQPEDECLVVFASRAIDFWWQNGGVQPPAEMRMHDLSDGFVLLAPYSQPKRIANISASAVQVRTDDGQAFVQIDAKSKNIDAVTPSDMSATIGGTLVANVTGSATLKAASVLIDSPSTHMTGTLLVDGQIVGKGGMAISGGSGATVTGSLKTTGDVVAAGISLDHHVHGGVQGGQSKTGSPE